MLLTEQVGAHHVEISEIEAVEALGQPCCQGHGIAVGHAVEAIQRGDANADMTGAPDRGNGLEDFEQKPGAIFDRAAIESGAFVSAVAKKFVDQVAIGGMDFNAIKAGELGVFGGFFKAGHDGRNLVIAKFAWDVVGLLAIRCVYLVVRDWQGAGSHWLRASIEERGTSPPAVPELEKDFSALGVNGVGHFAPTGNLGLGVNSWLGIKGRVSFDHHGGLGNDEARRSPLSVVFRHEFARNMLGFSPATREWRHEDAIGHFKSAELERLEKGGVRHRISFWW